MKYRIFPRLVMLPVSPCIHNQGEHTRIESVQCDGPSKIGIGQLLGKGGTVISYALVLDRPGQSETAELWAIYRLRQARDTGLKWRRSQFSVLCFRRDQLVAVESCNRGESSCRQETLVSSAKLTPRRSQET